MKVVIQRVVRASVTVGDREVSSIGKGICVLLGITRTDGKKEAEWMAKRILNVRVFENPETGKPWEKSVLDLGLEVLCISQFTLCHVLKSNKPDFHDALTAEKSEPMYHDFLKRLGSMYKPEAIKGGEFGAMMQVHIQNDGPTTLQFGTPNLPPTKERKPPNPPKKAGGADGGKKQKGSKPVDGETQNIAEGEAKPQATAEGETKTQGTADEEIQPQATAEGETKTQDIDSDAAEKVESQGSNSTETKVPE